MGGTVPLGYDVKSRKLVVNSAEAEQVREIYRQYLKLGCVSKLKAYLDRQGIRSKERVSRAGRKTGGAAYFRGALYKLLQNRIYLGEIHHRGQVYRGEHEAIVPRELWEKVQRRLEANNNAQSNGQRARHPSLLVGLLFDDRGNRFTPAHAVKNGKRYRYYVSQAAIKNPGNSHRGPIRIPAGEIESLICSRLQSFLNSPTEVINTLGLPRDGAASTQAILAAAKESAKRLDVAPPADRRAFIRSLTTRIVIHGQKIQILLNKHQVRNALLGNTMHVVVKPQTNGNGFCSLEIKACLRRSGREARLVLPSECSTETAGRPVPALIKAIARAHDWYERILHGRTDEQPVHCKKDWFGRALREPHPSVRLHCSRYRGKYFGRPAARRPQPRESSDPPAPGLGGPTPAA